MKDKLKILENSLDKVITPYASMKRDGSIISFVYKDINTLIKDKEALITKTREMNISNHEEIINMINDIYEEFILSASSDSLSFPDIKGDALKVYNSLNVINTCNYLLAKYEKEQILNQDNYAHLNNIIDIEFNDLDRLLTGGKAAKYYITNSKIKFRLVNKVKELNDVDKLEYDKYILFSNNEYIKDEKAMLDKLNVRFHKDIQRFYKKIRDINNYISEIDEFNKHFTKVKIYENEDDIEEINNLYEEANELFDLPFTENDLIKNTLEKLNDKLLNINSLNLKEKLGFYVKDLKFYYIESRKLLLKSNKLLDSDCNFIIDLITKDINKGNLSLSRGMDKINYLVKYFVKAKEIINKVRSLNE